MPNTREKLIRCLKYCASTTDTGNDCVACERWVYDCGSGQCVDDLLLQAAEALEQMRWIPVTERLPEKDGRFIVSDNTFGIRTITTLWFAKDGRNIDEYDFAEDWQNVWYAYDGEWGYVPYDTVTHWMPLPEPPKGE